MAYFYEWDEDPVSQEESQIPNASRIIRQHIRKVMAGFSGV
jgi:hypothetical protein